MRTSTTGVAALLLAGMVGIAGCGSDDTSASPETLAPATSTAAGGETDTLSGGLTDVCSALTEAEIADIVGGAVSREEIPGGGCSFSQDDPRAPTLAVSATPNEEATGGFDGAVLGATSVLEDAAGEELTGVGERAYVATGTTLGGSNQQGAGLVLAGGNLIQVTLVQGNGLSAGAVKDLVIDALRLSASKG